MVILAIGLELQGLPPQADPSGASNTANRAAAGLSSEWYDLYFTQPNSPADEQPGGGPEEALIAALAAARGSVDVAIYHLNLPKIRTALLAAHRRGVTVRVVTESENLESSEVQELIATGIPVMGDRREGLMHNKFIVIDRQDTWTGSLNLTSNGAYQDDNNLIRIRSSRLARNYTREFAEMFAEDLFGPGSPANTLYPVITVCGVQVETYFSPDDGVLPRLLELVGEARESIYFLAFAFTSDPLAEALLERAAAGVSVAGVFESSQVESSLGSEYENLQAAGLAVRLDGNPANMHHKVLIIDGKTVVTGSYNFSNYAEKRNDENTLVIHSPAVAAQFQAEFERVYAEGHD